MENSIQQKTNWLTLALCFVTTIFEGLDLQSMGVAAPKIVAELAIDSNEMGLIASASSVGLLIGALFGGMVSDYIGRKWVLIWSVVAFGTLSVLTPFAWDPNSLIAIRFGTGLGMGGALPMIIAIAAEAVDPKRRAGVVTMMYCATPIGGFIATFIALASDEWRNIFYVGGLAPLLLVPVLVKYLQESKVFTDAQQARNNTDNAPSISVSNALFSEKRAMPTLYIWLGFLCSVAVLYLLLNWLPLLLVGKGFSSAQASKVQMVFNVGGSTGALLLGYLITRYSPRWIFAFVTVAIALALISLAGLEHNMAYAILAGLVVGIFANGLVFLLYGQAGAYYPTRFRGTGVGSAVAVGRMGAIIGPLMAGVLLSADVSPSQVLLYILPLVLVAGGAIQLLFFCPKSESEE